MEKEVTAVQLFLTCGHGLPFRRAGADQENNAD